jgi:hypothetical protein
VHRGSATAGLNQFARPVLLFKQGVFGKEFIHLLFEFGGGHLKQPDGLLKLRGERELLAVAKSE